MCMQWKNTLIETLESYSMRKDLGTIRGEDAAPKNFVDNAINSMCTDEIADELITSIKEYCHKNSYGWYYQINDVISVVKDKLKDYGNFIFSITYNFDSAYICRLFNTEQKAIECLKKYLEEEIKIVRKESEYEPSVLKDNDTEITLIYEENALMYDEYGNRTTYDMAFYKVMEAD